jgi:hypothetical protein
MANRSNEAAGAAALNGLVGGFLQGHDLRRQRTQDQQAAEEIQRQRQRQEQADAFAIQDRATQRFDADLAREQEHGVYRTPGSLDGPGLRTRVGESEFFRDPNFQTPEQVEAAEELEINTRVAATLGDEYTPEDVSALRASGLIDNVFNQRTGGGSPEGPTYTVDEFGNVQGTGFSDPANARAFGATQPEQPEASLSAADLFDRTDKLADDFYRESADARSFAGAITQAEAAGDNAVGDQSLIFSINNLLDPGVTVRQDDFVRYAEAGDLTAKAERYWNMIGRDGRLPTEVRAQIVAEIAGIGAQKREQFERDLFDRYTRRAVDAGVNPADVVSNPFLVSGAGMFDDLVPGN